MKSLSFSQSMHGFLLACEAQHLSHNTIRVYEMTLRRFAEFLDGDPALADIDADAVRRFLAQMSQPQPRDRGVVKNIAPAPLSGKTLLNYHTALAALWSWAVRERIVADHVVHQVKRPIAEKPTIALLTQADMRALLAACERSREYDRPGKRTCDNQRPTALRDRTILLLLLDTGMRASELCGLTPKDVDLRNRRVFVTGKGRKERLLPISADTARVVWRFLGEERAEARVSEPVFLTLYGQPLSRTALLDLVHSLGERAGVADVHPHRFRHTFAVNFLRNGGNVYELQMALGHTTLEMCQTYLHLAQTDLDQAHREASPVAKWRLVRR